MKHKCEICEKELSNTYEERSSDGGNTWTKVFRHWSYYGGICQDCHFREFYKPQWFPAPPA